MNQSPGWYSAHLYLLSHLTLPPVLSGSGPKPGMFPGGDVTFYPFILLTSALEGKGPAPVIIIIIHPTAEWRPNTHTHPTPAVHVAGRLAPGLAHPVGFEQTLGDAQPGLWCVCFVWSCVHVLVWKHCVAWGAPPPPLPPPPPPPPPKC